jgi:hypothetical protein
VKHRKRVTCVALNADGSRMASASDDKLVRITQVAGSAEEQTLELPEKVGAMAFMPAADPAVAGDLVVVGHDGTLTIWGGIRTPVRKLLLELPHHGNLNTCLDVAPDGRFLATGSFRTATVWDRPAARSVLEVQATGAIEAVRLCRGGELLVAVAQGTFASSGSPGSVRGWEMPSGREVFAWDLDGHAHVAGASISGDGRWLAAVRYNARTAQVWDLESRRTVAYLEHPGSVHSLAFSPDGRLLAVDSGNKSVYLWAPKSGS